MDLTKKDVLVSSPVADDLFPSWFMRSSFMAIKNPFDEYSTAAVPASIWHDLHDPINRESMELFGVEVDDDEVLYPLAVYLFDHDLDVADIDLDVMDRFNESFIGYRDLKDFVIDQYCEDLACRGADQSMIDFCVSHLDEVSYLLELCEGVISAFDTHSGHDIDHYDYSLGGFPAAGGRDMLTRFDISGRFLLFWDLR